MTYTFKADEVEEGPEVEYEWEVQVYYNKPVISAKNADGYSSLAQIVANCAVTVAGSVKLAHIYAVMNETVPGTEWVDDDAEEVLPVLQNIAPFFEQFA